MDRIILAALVLATCLLAGSAEALSVSRQHQGRKLKASPEQPPLRIKLLALDFEQLLQQAVASAIAQVDSYAAANSRRRVTYLGTVTDLAAELAEGNFDMLLVYTQEYYDSVVFSVDQQALIAAALGSGTLKKLAVWHTWHWAGVDTRVPGLSAAGVECSSFLDPFASSVVANPSVYAHVTAGGAASSKAPIYGDAASHGACTKASINDGALDTPVRHTWLQDDKELISGFSFCYGRDASIFYSQMPLGYYLQEDAAEGRGYMDAKGFGGILNYHVNALAALTNQVSCPGPPKRPSEVVVSATWLPPNGKLVSVTLQSVGINRDSVLPRTVAVTGIQYYDMQAGKPPKRPLAVWPTEATRGDVSSVQVQLRAERNGAGSGRWYRIQYTAGNELGSYGGNAYVLVPHDASLFTTARNVTLPATGIANVTALPKSSMVGAPGIKAPTWPAPSSIPEEKWMSTV